LSSRLGLCLDRLGILLLNGWLLLVELRLVHSVRVLLVAWLWLVERVICCSSELILRRCVPSLVLTKTWLLLLIPILLLLLKGVGLLNWHCCVESSEGSWLESCRLLVRYLVLNCGLVVTKYVILWHFFLLIIISTKQINILSCWLNRWLSLFLLWFWIIKI